MLTQDARNWVTSLGGRSILFEDTPQSFLGRNGVFNAVGVHTDRLGDKVEITPVTGKGYLGRCRIELPVVALPAFIAALQRLLPTGRRGKSP